MVISLLIDQCKWSVYHACGSMSLVTWSYNYLQVEQAVSVYSSPNTRLPPFFCFRCRRESNFTMSWRNKMIKDWWERQRCGWKYWKRWWKNARKIISPKFYLETSWLVSQEKRIKWPSLKATPLRNTDRGNTVVWRRRLVESEKSSKLWRAGWLKYSLVCD